MRGAGKIFVVGCGALTAGSLTLDAFEVLKNSDVIVGYTAYVNQIMKILPEAEYVKTGMKHEVERIYIAAKLAKEGKKVSVICSGDSGIYAMAGLVFEVLEKEGLGINVQVIPGVPALAICAATLGAPLMNDFAVISFSNLLTPEDMIEKRLTAFLDAGVVIVIYNPVSNGRKALFGRLWAIIKKKRNSCFGGYVKSGGKPEEKFGIHRIRNMPVEVFDMHTLIIIGNEFTDKIKNQLVTKRGYQLT
jgi:precorrin-3B C17-methyltransferase